jgi:hypothetical protein
MGEVQLKLHGGPDDGRWVKYAQPVPKTLVVPHVKSVENGLVQWNDYRRRKPGGVDFDYVGDKE